MNVNKIEEREHEVFAQTFTRRAIGSILAGMVSLGLCIASAKSGLDMLAVVFCIAFLGSGAYALIYLNYRLRHVRCPECGYDYSDFRNVGRFGCPECYRSFEAQLNPLLRHVHGSTQHAGKTPVRLGVRSASRQKILRLKEELGRAIESEDYERAAELRDEIRNLDDTGGAPPAAGENPDRTAENKGE